jgi:YHS domain-containing protein
MLVKGAVCTAVRDGKPQKGVAEISATYDGGTYWFSSQEHKASFVASP